MSSVSSSNRRPRVLVVTRNLPPLVGGMERLNWHMAEELSRLAEVHIIGPEGSAAQGPKGVTFTEVALHPLWKFLFLSATNAVRIAKEWRPDLVLAGSGLTAPAAYFGAKVAKARCTAYVHGLDITVKHPIYQYAWLPFIRRMDTIIVNSSVTRRLAIAANVTEDRIHTVYPGVSLPAQPVSLEAKQHFLGKYGLEGKSLLISVGRLTSRKGLREFVQNSLPGIVYAHPHAVLVIIGESPSNALGADLQSPQSIMDTARAGKVEKNIRLLGSVSEAELATAFECASLHIFPIRNIPNDPEGFGMVAIEAAAHGVPTVAFANGGVIDAVAVGRSGELLPPDDYEGMARTVLNILRRSPENKSWREGCISFARQFEWTEFGVKMNAALRVDDLSVSLKDKKAMDNI